MKKKTLSLLLAVAMVMGCMTGCGGAEEDFTANMSDDEKAAWEAAANDPYGKYPELVTYTTGYVLPNLPKLLYIGFKLIPQIPYKIGV